MEWLISRTLLFFASFLTLSSLHAQTATDWISGALDTNNLVFDNFSVGFSLDDETGSVGGTSVVSTQPTTDALLDLVLRLKAH